ncbi:MAG: hypothetical protein U0903_16190 [Planctomycetales bacterium]
MLSLLRSEKIRPVLRGHFRCLGVGLFLATLFTCGLSPVNAQLNPRLRLPQRPVPRPGTDQPALMRNYELSGWRKAAFQLLNDNQTAAGLRQLQKIFDSLEDGFEPVGTEGKVVGIKQIAADWLDKADPAIRKLYEQLYGQQAFAVLKEERDGNRLQVYSEVYGRWFHTRAGAEAAYRLMLWHWDHGTPELAVRYGERLLRDSWHAAELSDVRRTAAMVTALRSGESQTVQESGLRIDTAGYTIGPDQVTVKQWIRNQSPEPLRESTDWDQPIGSGTRNFEREGSPPTANALWRRSLLTGLREDYENNLQRWWTGKRQQSDSSGSGQSPVIVGDQLIFRDAVGVHAVHLQTGAELWHYRTSYQFQKVLDILRDDEGRTARDDEYERMFLHNSILGSLSTDGERVYLIDGLVGDRRNAAGDPLSDDPGWRMAYRLVALSIPREGAKSNGEGVSVAWSVGGAGRAESGAEDLQEHLFLGPPTVAYGKLYAISESQGAMTLVELDPVSGRAMRIIPYAMQQIPINLELSRANWVCIPSISRGIAVCPTFRGMLVGIDLASDALLWVHSGSATTSSGVSRFGAHRRVQGHEGFFNLPLIQGGLIFDLTRHSQVIECVELLTGEDHWQPISRSDGEYLACATNDVLLVVGQQGCRGLDVQTGKELWSVRLGASSGRGVRLGDCYLLPLANGQIVNLEIKTGLQRGYPAPLAEERIPGHLLACRDMVVSVTPVDLAVYPQSRVMLQQLLVEKTSLDPAERQLRIGELQLRIGDLTTAQQALQSAVTLSRNESAAPRKEEAERLLRELYCIELSRPGTELDQVLKNLQVISRRPEDRVRYLAFESEIALQKGELTRALLAGRELTSMPTEVTLSLPREPQLQVASRTWGAEQLERLLKQAPAQEIRETDRLFAEEYAQAKQRKSVEEWERLFSLYRRGPHGTLIREELARRLLVEGATQQGELLLLKNRECGIPAREAEATRMLVELWGACGFYEEAGECLHQLQTRYARERLHGGALGAEFARNYPRSELASEYARRFVPLDEPVESVRVSLRLGEGKSNNSLNLLYGPSSLLTDFRGSFMLMDREQMRTLAMVDRETGQVVQDFVLPNSAGTCRGGIGHLYPFGGQTTACAVSLIERKVLWDKLTWKGTPLNGLLLAGPSGSDFALFHARQELFLADPCTGKIRWRRNDMDPTDGLYRNGAANILGDDQIIVVFSNDQSDYRVFDTLSGRELRRGRLPNPGWRLPPFGRMLVYRTTEQGKSGFNLWDPLTDEFLMRGWIAGQLWFVDETGTREFAFVNPEGELHIVHAPTGERRLRVKLAREDLRDLNSMEFFSDQSRYYVNLKRSVTLSPEQQAKLSSRSIVPEIQLPKAHLHGMGELYAFEKGTGKFLWKRPQPNQTFIHMPQYPLPFLLGLSVYRFSDNATHYSARMQLEVIDCHSGQTLALKKELPKDQLTQMVYDRDAKTISLRGQQNEWLLEFSSKGNRLDAEDEISLAR